MRTTSRAMFLSVVAGAAIAAGGVSVWKRASNRSRNAQAVDTRRTDEGRVAVTSDVVVRALSRNEATTVSMGCVVEITDSRGVVAGASIEAAEFVDQLISGRDRYLASTDEYGIASLELGERERMNWLLVTTKRGAQRLVYLPDLKPIGDRNERRLISIRISESTSVPILVTDRLGKPISEALVCGFAAWGRDALRMDPERKSSLTRLLAPTSMTGRDGRCSLAVAEDQQYWVDAAAFGFVPSLGNELARDDEAGTTFALDRVMIGCLRLPDEVSSFRNWPTSAMKDPPAPARAVVEGTLGPHLEATLNLQPGLTWQFAAEGLSTNDSVEQKVTLFWIDGTQQELQQSFCTLNSFSPESILVPPAREIGDHGAIIVRFLDEGGRTIPPPSAWSLRGKQQPIMVPVSQIGKGDAARVRAPPGHYRLSLLSRHADSRILSSREVVVSLNCTNEVAIVLSNAPYSSVELSVRDELERTLSIYNVSFDHRDCGGGVTHFARGTGAIGDHADLLLPPGDCVMYVTATGYAPLVRPVRLVEGKQYVAATVWLQECVEKEAVR